MMNLISDFSGIRAVVFDLDGTLYDKRRLPARMIAGEFFRLGLLAAERNARRTLRGRYFGSEDAFYKAFFAEMAHGHCFTVRQAEEWYNTRYMPLMVSALQHHYKPAEWVAGTLSALREHDIPAAVCSDYGCVEEKMRALGLDITDFAFVTSAPALGGLKPCREVAAQLIDRLGVPAENVLFVGDRDETDGAMARAVMAQFKMV